VIIIPGDATSVVPSQGREGIDRAEGQLHASLPDICRELWFACDGCVVGSWSFYSTDTLAERNETAELSGYAPGWIAIGDDGGGNLLLARVGDPALYVADVSSPDIRTHLAVDAKAWIEAGCPAVAASRPDEAALGDVLVNGQVGDLKDVMLLRSHFEIAGSLAELVSRLRSTATPCLTTISLAGARRAARSLPAALAARLVYVAPDGQRLSIC